MLVLSSTDTEPARWVSVLAYLHRGPLSTRPAGGLFPSGRPPFSGPARRLARNLRPGVMDPPRRNRRPGHGGNRGLAAHLLQLHGTPGGSPQLERPGRSSSPGPGTLAAQCGSRPPHRPAVAPPAVVFAVRRSGATTSRPESVPFAGRLCTQPDPSARAGCT